MVLFLRGLLPLLVACSAFGASTNFTSGTVYNTAEDNEGEIYDLETVNYRWKMWTVNLDPTELLSCSPAGTYAVRYTESVYEATGNLYRGITFFMFDGEEYTQSNQGVLEGDFSQHCGWRLVNTNVSPPTPEGNYTFPIPPGGTPTDYDGDSIPDATDPDDDNDGIIDSEDSHPKDPTRPGGGGGGGDPGGGGPPLPPGGGGGGGDVPGDPDDGPGGGGGDGRTGITSPAFGFGTLVGNWSTFSGIGATDYTLSFSLPIPGGEPQTFTFHSMPDTSTTLGAALNTFRLLLRSLLTLLLIFAFGKRIYRDLVNY